MKNFKKTISLGRVLVFGASGWLGRRLVNILIGEQNDTGLKISAESVALVVKTDDEKLLFDQEKTNIFVADIRDERQLANVFSSNLFDTIFILTGIIHPSRILEFYEINYLGVSTVTEKALDYKAKSIVIMSSNSPFGFNNSESAPFNNFSEYRPYQNYGKSKMLMEQKIASFNTEKSSISVIRSPWFYGPGQPSRQKKFFSMVKNGIFPIYCEGNYLRSMAYLDNIIQGLILAANKKKSGVNFYWIADKKPYKFTEIIETIQKIFENEFNISVKKRKFVLPTFLKPAAQFADTLIQKSGFYSEKIHVFSELGEHIFCDIFQSEKDLGYRPKVSLYEGMFNSIKDFEYKND